MTVKTKPVYGIGCNSGIEEMSLFSANLPFIRFCPKTHSENTPLNKVNRNRIYQTKSRRYEQKCKRGFVHKFRASSF